MKYTNALGACANCGVLTSPCWRKGPEYARHLCNACGSRYLTKGTLEGYRPGQRNRSGGRRSKGKSRRSSSSQSTEKEGPPATFSRGSTQMLDKAVQVDPAELQQMPPFVRLQTLSSTNVAPLLGSGSPEPQELAVKREDLLPGMGYCPGDSKESCQDSLQNPDDLTGVPAFSRKRSRKPANPCNSGW